MTTAQSETSFANAFVGPSGKSLFPGGFNRSTFAIADRTKMLVSGSGYLVFDEDGREILDFNNNFTSQIHGNAHPEIVEAACSAAKAGTSFGMPTFPELEHASALIHRVPYMEQVRYTNSGTEAVMLAIRVARATTGRDLVIFVDQAYHGSSDVAALAGPSHLGIPGNVGRDVSKLPINDLTALEELFDNCERRVAALVLDTMPNRAGLVPLDLDYILKARELATRHGALLISDEVIALRQSYRGSMFDLGITPDLLTVGKIVGGGFPVGGVLGGAEALSVLDPTRSTYIEHGGTFTGNPVTMRAGLKSLELLTDNEIKRLNGLGQLFRTLLTDSASSLGWQVRGAGSLARVLPKPGADLPQESSRHLWMAAYERGLLLTQNNLVALSTPMNESVIQDAVERLLDAMGTVTQIGASK